MIETVLGQIRPDQMQACLTHEHLTVWGTNEASIAIREQALQTIVPLLCELREKYHCNTLVECTPCASTGRDLLTYAEIARQAKFHVIASTGFYYVKRSPWWMKEASVKELVRRWKKEACHGMDGTGIRPGMLKATSGYEISDRRRRNHEIVNRWTEALARTHNETGLPITTHVHENTLVEQLNALMKYGVAPSAITLGHADGNGAKVITDQLLMVADQGAYLSFNCGCDYIASNSGVLKVMGMVKFLVDRGYLNQITLSVDTVFSAQDQQKLRIGNRKRTYRAVFTRMVPALEKLGFSKGQIHHILVDNPRRHLNH